MHHSILVSTSLFAPANWLALLGRWAIWNVVSLTTSHFALTGCHLSVVKKLSAWFFSLFNFSSPIGLQVLEVVDLLLAAHVCPARSEVFMCQ